jgi:predicted HTH transcriptional regulator
MQKEALKWMQELNERQIQLVQFVQHHGRITRRQYEELTQIGGTVAKQDLRGLIARGLLVRRGAGPGTYYVIPESSRLSDNLAPDRRPIATGNTGRGHRTNH